MLDRTFEFLHHSEREDKRREKGLAGIRGPYDDPIGSRDVLGTLGRYVDVYAFSGGYVENLLVSDEGVKQYDEGVKQYEDVERYDEEVPRLGFDVVGLDCMRSGVWRKATTWGLTVTGKGGGE